MFSKKISLALVVALTSMSFLGCDKFLRSSKSDSEKDEKVVIETGKELACMSEMPPKLARFFKDESTLTDLPSAVSCLQSSLKSFMEYTEGEDENSYTGKELQHFFNRYLLKNSQISDEFRVEIMKLKVVLVGGTSEHFTRTELESFSRLMGQLGNKLQTLRGNIKLTFFSRPEGKVTSDEVKNAQGLVKEAVIFFLENTKIISAKYELGDLVKLAREVDKFVGDNSATATVFKWEPLVTAVKVLFLGENSKLSNLSEWKTTFSWAVDTYFAIIRWNYLIRPLEYEQPLEWNILMAWTDQIFALIESSPQMKQDKLLEASKIDILIDQIYKQELIKTSIDKELAKRTYRKFIANILERNNARGSAALEVPGVSLQHLKTLRHEYRVWRLSQQFLVDTFIKAKRLSVSPTTRNLRDEANKYDFGKMIDSMNVDALEREELEQSWNDFRSFIFTSYPIVLNGSSKMIMDFDLPTRPNTLVGGNSLNSYRSYLRLIIRGYGENKERSLFANQVPKQRLIDMEEDFHEIAIKAGIFDPRTKNPADQTFTEANFLTYNGDGNDMLSAHEGVQVLAQMFSGGNVLMKQLIADLDLVHKYMVAKKSGKCYSGKLDDFGKKMIDEVCFKAVFKKFMDKYFEALPNAAKYLTSLNEAQFNEYFKAAMMVAYNKWHQAGMLEQSEARSLMVVTHYLESLMVVYDTNKDSALDEQELLKALPRFEKFIAKISPTGNWFVDDIFLFMVYKGEKPGVVSLPKFKYERSQGLGKTNRLNLIKVLGLLKSESRAEAILLEKAKAAGLAK